MSELKAIIFDYCNVLEGPLDTGAFAALKESLARQTGFASGDALWNHFYVDQTWQDAKRGKMTAEAFWDNRLSAIGISDKDEQQQFLETFFQYHDIYPQMRDIVEELKPQYRLCIVSNADRTDLDSHIREAKGFGDSFEFIISSAVVGCAKPDPEIYLMALEQLHLEPEQTLFIDDLVRNTSVAEELGIPSIIFTSPSNLEQQLQARGILNHSGNPH